MFKFLFPNKKFECFSCPSVFDTDQERHQHIITQHSRRLPQTPLRAYLEFGTVNTLKCQYCNLKFSTESSRGIHVRVEHLECNICKFQLSSPAEKQAHIQSHHTFKCIHCDLIFTTDEIRKKHVQYLHSQQKMKPITTDKADKLKCLTCERVFKSTEAKNKHMWYAHSIICEICYVKITKIDSLESHILQKHNHKCGTCNFIFSSNAQLQKHFEANLHYKCEVCQVICLNLEERNLHFKTSHAIMCNLCNIEYKTAVEKKNHMDSHHKCYICNTSWFTIEERTNHFDNRHPSCRNCKVVFKNKFDLKKHRCTIEKEEAPQYKCNICNVKFRVEQDLQKHRFEFRHYEFKCVFCPENYILAEEREAHVNNVHLFKCSECTARFSTKQTMDQHILIQHTQSLHCNFCNVNCLSPELKEQHDSNYHRFVCGFCKRIYPSEIALNQHSPQCFHQIQNINFNNVVENQIKCDHCNTFWKTPVERDQHHHLAHIIYCNICEKVFKGHVQRLQHFADKHLQKCEKCCGTFPTPEFRDKHLKDFHNKSDFKCEECNGTWATAKERDDHVIQSHNITCHVCFAQFNTTEEFDVHYTETHLYKCGECGSTWSSEKLKDFHYEEIHTISNDTKQFLCSLCGENLHSSDQIDRHIKLMHNWNCTVCNKIFKTNADKDQHINLVHLHLCEVCDKPFNTDTLLERHFKMVHQWDCEYCDKIYTSEASLQRHYNSIHPSEEIEIIQNYLCSECDELFDTEEFLINHYNEEHVEKGPRVFFDITANDVFIGRVVMELRPDIVPKTAENFRQLCTGENGFGYKGSIFHHIIPNYICQGGDITEHNGNGGTSIYGKYFPDESFELKHCNAGVLSMANTGPDSNNSQFFITMVKMTPLDNRKVVFGRVVKGMDVVKKIETYGTNLGIPSVKVVINYCGQLELEGNW